MSLCSMAVGAYILLPRLVDFFQSPPPPAGVVITKVGFRLLLMLAVWGCLLAFWVLRSGKSLFVPMLVLASIGSGTSITWLCIHGRDPASWVAFLFLSTLLMNAFARSEYEARIRRNWIREDLPFEVRALRYIIPGMIGGICLGALSAWAWFAGFPKVPPILLG
jgi:hypothetical protein